MSDPSNESLTVALVGHCGFDSGGLARQCETALPGCKVVRINREDELAEANAAVWLVNRALDGRFERGTGVDLIERHAAQPQPPAMLLVSNYPDAQADAERAGAKPGFGKDHLGTPQAEQAIRAAAGRTTTSG